MNALRGLKERKLVQWGLAYLAGAWLLLQILDFLRENFDWSPAVVRGATVLLAVGFLAALVLAWYHGEKGRQRVSVVEFLLLTALLGAGAAATVLLPAGRDPARLGTASDALSSGSERVTRGADPSVTLAIMPFDYLSAGGDDAFIAEGLGVAEAVVPVHVRSTRARPPGEL